MARKNKPPPLLPRSEKVASPEKAAKIEKSLRDNPPDLKGERFTHLVRTLPPELLSATHRYSAVAACVIVECLRVNAVDPEADAFFEYDSPEGPHSYHLTTRIGVVGEALWKLRHSPGFPEFCARLRSRDRRAAFYEIIAASTMLDCGFAIHAKAEIGTKGEDFDLSAVRDGISISVEATALRPLVYSSTTVANALEQKRKQVPTNQPAIIFCGCPPNWFDTVSEMGNELRRDAEEFFRRSKRTNAVVFVTETRFELAPDEDGAARGMLAFPIFPFLHSAPRHPIDLSCLLDGSLDQNKKYGLMVSPEDAIEAMRKANEFHRWVDGILGTT